MAAKVCTVCSCLLTICSNSVVVTSLLLQPTVEELKELGNAAVKAQKYEESILHYTHAIKLDPKNYVLYSNRSFAFLKMQQYYYAIEDANETIKLNPKWPKVNSFYEQSIK